MNNLLLPGEVLDHEAMARASRSEFHFNVTDDYYLRACSPCHGLIKPETVINRYPDGNREGSDIWFFNTIDGRLGGCGFCRSSAIADSEVMPLSFIKTVPRQALEALKARLDRGALL